MEIGKVRLLAALSSLVILATLIGSTQSTSCCLRYTKRQLMNHRLLGYTIQTINNSCDINAIIFHFPGRFVCADPSMKWTQRAMTYVDEKRRKMAEISSGMIPGPTSA